MRGKNVDAETKATAVGLALMTSGAEAARQMGLPERTVQQWVASPEFAELRATPREDVGEAMWVAVQEAVYALREGVVNPKAYLRDKVAAFEALVEKRALIMGEATSRMETRSLGELDDDKRAALKRFIMDELQRRRAGDSDPGNGVDAGAASVPA